MPSLPGICYTFFFQSKRDIRQSIVSNWEWHELPHLSFISKWTFGAFFCGCITKLLLVNISVDYMEMYHYNLFINWHIWAIDHSIHALCTAVFVSCLILYTIFYPLLSSISTTHKNYRHIRKLIIGYTCCIMLFIWVLYMSLVIYFGILYNDYDIHYTLFITSIHNYQSKFQTQRYSLYYLVSRVFQMAIIFILFYICIVMVSNCCFNNNNNCSSCYSGRASQRLSQSMSITVSRKSVAGDSNSKSDIEMSLLESVDSAGITKQTAGDIKYNMIDVNVTTVIRKFFWDIICLSILLFIFVTINYVVDSLDTDTISNHYYTICNCYLLSMIILKRIIRIIARNIDEKRIKYIFNTDCINKNINNNDISIMPEPAVSLEILLVVLIDMMYWVQYRFFTIYFDHITYQQFLIFKSFHCFIDIIDTFLVITPFYYNQTQMYYNKCCLSSIYNTNNNIKKKSSIAATIWTFDECSKTVWLNRATIDIAIKMIASHVSIVYVGIRSLVAVLMGWETYRYQNFGLKHTFLKSMLFLLISFVINICLYISAQLVFKKMYKYQMFAAFYELVTQSEELKKAYFLTFVVVVQCAMWMW